MYEIKYRPGKQLQDADCLSRNPDFKQCTNTKLSPFQKVEVLQTYEHHIINEPPINPVTDIAEPFQIFDKKELDISFESLNDRTGKPLAYKLNIYNNTQPTPLAMSIEKRDYDLYNSQRNCPETSIIIDFITKNEKHTNLPESVIANRDKFLMSSEGILLHIHITRPNSSKKNKHLIQQIVLPINMRHDIFKDYHDRLTHSGFEATFQAIQRHYWWRTLRKDLVHYIDTCTKCQQMGRKTQHTPLGTYPERSLFDAWHIDHFKLSKESPNGNRFVLVAVESLSRFPELIPVKTTNAQDTARAIFDHIICRYGVPTSIISDRNTSFINLLMKTLCELLQVKQNFTAPYHPRSNGMAESMVKRVKSSLKSLISPTQTDWELHLPSIALAHRIMPNSSTNYSPAFVMYGADLTLSVDKICKKQLSDIHPNVRDELSQFIDHMKNIRTITQENITYAHERMRAYHDSKAKHTTYAVGDLVWLYKETTPVSLDHKLICRFDGAYEVIQVFNNSYKLRHTQTNKETSFINASRLKKARSPTESVIRSYSHNTTTTNRTDTQTDTPTNTQPDTPTNTRTDTPTNTPDTNHHTAPRQKQSTSHNDKQHDQNKIVEQVLNLKQMNRDRHYLIKLAGHQWPYWISQTNANKQGIIIPAHLIADALRTHTWTGKPRQRLYSNKSK